MPVSVKELFNRVGLEPEAPVRWRSSIPTNSTGVYVISLSPNPLVNINTCETCEVNEKVIEDWKSLSPEINIQGELSKVIIEAELNRFWKPTENILYIGESSSATNGLSKRINQFYIHEVGWKGPHTGGYWIKLLSQLTGLYVYYAACNNPRDTEFKMLMYFIERTTGKSFYELDELGKHLPFANLKVDFQKKHNIKNAVKKKASGK